MKTDLFHLEILPLEKIVEHEVFDAGRTQPLIERIQAEQMLVNPILVTQLDDDSYMQLDGMNRLSAFRRLGIPAIPAQIVDYADDDQVVLRSWSHLYTTDTVSIVTALREDAQIRLVDYSHPTAWYPAYEKGWIATIIQREGRVLQVFREGSDSEKAEAIVRLVASYKSAGIFREILPQTLNREVVDHAFATHTASNGIVLFPTFSKHQIVSLVKDGGVLPSGITRHIVQNRILNARIPLDLLKSTQTVIEKNHRLDTLLRARAIRLYQEPVVYIE